MVDNVPKKYDGKQAISLAHTEVTIPLKYNGALMYMPIRKPTRKELNEEETFDLTDYKTWNPRQDESDDIDDQGCQQITSSIVEQWPSQSFQI